MPPPTHSENPRNSKSDEAAAPTAGRPSSVQEPNKRKDVKEELGTRGAATVPGARSDGTVEDGAGREKLKRHRIDVAGRVWVPDMWGQENFLKDWTDCAAADASLVNSSIVLARDSLIKEARRSAATSNSRLRIQNMVVN